MPFLFFVLLIILIAQIGFWKTLGAVIGAAAMLVLLIVLLIAVVIVGGLAFATRMIGRGGRP
jgi:hypothetical protein